MSMFKLTSSGGWSVYSKTDPRWNGNGCTSSCGGFTMPREAQEHIDRLKALYGEPPDDLEYSYMKD